MVDLANLTQREKMLLFLDFDGVLHPEYIPGETPGRYRVNQDHFSCLPRLESLLREFEDIDVVISSTWRETRTLAELQAFFSPDLRARIIGATPKLPKVEGRRQREIEAWLTAHQRETSNWMALDDWPSLFDQGCPNVFFTDTLIGLDEEAAERLREWFKAKRREVRLSA